MRLVSALICCLAAPLLLGLAPAVALADSPPSVGPIHALFVQAEFATHYSVTATDPAGRPLTYKWSLVPPALRMRGRRPVCGGGGRGGARGVRRAESRHRSVRRGRRM
ncbi:MAG: hypothetical protein WCC30_15630 [Candidatus Dormiibacterota bacterium]